MLEFPQLNFTLGQVRSEQIMRQEQKLEEIKRASPDRDTPKKICDAYGEVYFPAAPIDRPYTYGSVVMSMDGKIAFTDDPQGPLIASKNLQDPDGAIADFWLLNMLRFYADAVITGANTIAAEPSAACNVMDPDLAQLRVPSMGKREYCPWQVIVSYDGTDIPYNHQFFSLDTQTIIGVSPDGMEYVRSHANKECIMLGPYARAEEVDEAQVRAVLDQCDHSKLLVIGTGTGATTDSAALLKVLRVLGVERLLLESPFYMAHLMGLRQLDEMFINLSAVYTGGNLGFGAFQQFTAEDHPHAEFLQINCHKAHFLSTRQKLTYGLKG